MRLSFSILLVHAIIGGSQATPDFGNDEMRIVGGTDAELGEFPYFGKQKLGAHSFLSNPTHFRGILLIRRCFSFTTRLNQKPTLVARRDGRAVVH